MPTLFQERSSAPGMFAPLAGRRLRAAVSALAVGSLGLWAVRAGAQERMTPVSFWAAGHIIPLATPALSSGVDTYIPLSALPAIGARGTLGARRDGVSVRLRSGRIDVLPFIRRGGLIMVSLADLAESADGTVIKPTAVPTAGLKPRTAYLLAHITDIHLQGSELHVTTSFSVPFVSNTLPGAIARGYVDCVGAVVARGFKPSRIPLAERRAERIRIGQFSPNIARVVVDLSPGVSLERNSTEGKVTHNYVAALEFGREPGRVARAPRRTSMDPGFGGEPLPPSTHKARSSQATFPDDYGDAAPPRNSGNTAIRRRPRPVDQDTLPPAIPTPVRTADIRSIAYESQDNQSIQIIIETSRKARAFVRYSATSRQVIIDIPNSRLNLDDERQKEQEIQHALVEGLTAATVHNSPRLPPLTRITIDSPRIVTTSVESTASQIAVEITVPRTTRNAKKRPAVKGGTLVVIDAGHGGKLTGAKARVQNHAIYEKDITLAIASKLRAALVSRGSRVVMTRTSDVNVDLEDRPRIANEIGATVFISIHNDSYSKQNEISGTTAYYHGKSLQSRQLAKCVEKELASVTGLRDRGAMSDTNMYPVGFCVLRDTDMPAVLCEVGYLNNKKDRSKLMDSAFQQRVAEAVCSGICNYVAREQPTSSHSAKVQAPAA